jgi:dTMP kinase
MHGEQGETPENNGHFIVFEGIDGSGTTTQIERYAAHLKSKQRQVFVTRQPSHGPIGALLRQGLTGRVDLGREYQAHTMALLFAADRLDHLATKIESNLRDGAVVLCDRYDLSSLVYQSATASDGAGDSVAWIRELNRHARRPDATIVIDVSPDVADGRRRTRAQAAELYEVVELQRRLAALYADAESLVVADRVIHIAGDESVDDVAQRIIQQLDPIIDA